MNITLYKIKYCPRCHMAKKHILKALSKTPGITYQEVDVLSSPQKAWREGVRMIPSIKIAGKTLSGAILKEAQIVEFIKNNTPQ